MADYDVNALDAIIERYSKRIEEIRKNEIYKWEAAYCFRQHWNPDADDFPTMLETSLSKASNLLIGQTWYPAGMLKIFADREPKTVRLMMLELFDESQPLRNRLMAFTDGAVGLLERANKELAEKGKQPMKNHFQDTRSMSVYLAFANPQQNYLYKAGMYKSFAKAIGIDVPGNKFDKVVAYKGLCDSIIVRLKERWGELIAHSDELLAPEYQEVDPAHHILVQDIVYYAVSYMPEEEKAEKEGGGTENSANVAEDAPRIWVYAPGENAWAWDECLQDHVMLLGWDDLGDFAQYGSREEMGKRLQELEGTDKQKSNDSLACWQFQNELAPGDVIYAKRGLYSIVGKGVVSSDARFEPDRERYFHVRDVDWTVTGDWDIRTAAIPMGGGETMKTLPMKTLTEWTMYPDAVEAVEQLIAGAAETGGAETSDYRYWWLSASPKIWSFSDIAIGDEQSYTLYNEKGNPPPRARCRS